jgi:hypothetical protein
MTSTAAIPSDDLQTKLAIALGVPDSVTIEPYFAYIVNSAGGINVEDYLELFIFVLEHFESQQGRTIKSLIDHLIRDGFRDMFPDPNVGIPRNEQVEDTVMCIIGTWATMLSSFQRICRVRKVTAAYTIFSRTVQSPKSPYDENVTGLNSGSELLPGGKWDYRSDTVGGLTTTTMLPSNTNSAATTSSLQNLPIQSIGHSSPSPNGKLLHCGPSSRS